MVAFSRLWLFFVRNGTTGQALRGLSIARWASSRCSRHGASGQRATPSFLQLNRPVALRRRRGVLQRGRLRRTSASGPLRLPERPASARLGDAAPVAPQAAAPAISAKRRPGAPPRGFPPRPPSGCRLLAAKEKSLLAVQSLHISQGNDLCACSRVPFSFWGPGGCPGCAQN